MKASWTLVIVASAVFGVAHADDLCKVNPYSRGEAQQGKAAFNSHCGLCHQYSMKGRVPGEAEHELPDMKLLSEGDWEFLKGGGGNVPPLIGPKFFSQFKDKTLVDFSVKVAGAANSFPPNAPLKMELPLTYFQIAAYVLYRNCGLM